MTKAPSGYEKVTQTLLTIGEARFLAYILDEGPNSWYQIASLGRGTKINQRQYHHRDSLKKKGFIEEFDQERNPYNGRLYTLWTITANGALALDLFENAIKDPRIKTEDE